MRAQRGSVLLTLALLCGVGALAVAPSTGFRSFGTTRRLPPQRAAEIQLDNLAAALDMYRMDHKRLPVRLDALVETTDSVPEPYLSALPTDPWGRPYVYAVAGKTYTLRSLGPDGRADTADDVLWPKPGR